MVGVRPSLQLEKFLIICRENIVAKTNLRTWPSSCRNCRLYNLLPVIGSIERFLPLVAAVVEFERDRA